jgi:peptide-methionine (S)-S-oxide reductase
MNGSEARTNPPPEPATTERATVAGGCFWCTEAVFAELDGVLEVVSGYTGGHVPNPSYEEVCDGTTGHAEAVRITYDPLAIGYRELLEVFFASHDPTTLDRQGNDVGSQYRSAVFTHDAVQRQLVEEVIAELTEEGVFDSAIVTQVSDAGPFFPAETYHQRFYARNPEYGYCRIVINPKLAKMRRRFAHRLRRQAAT